MVISLETSSNVGDRKSCQPCPCHVQCGRFTEEFGAWRQGRCKSDSTMSQQVGLEVFRVMRKFLCGVVVYLKDYKIFPKIPRLMKIPMIFTWFLTSLLSVDQANRLENHPQFLNALQSVTLLKLNLHGDTSWTDRTVFTQRQWDRVLHHFEQWGTVDHSTVNVDLEVRLADFSCSRGTGNLGRRKGYVIFKSRSSLTWLQNIRKNQTSLKFIRNERCEMISCIYK